MGNSTRDQNFATKAKKKPFDLTQPVRTRDGRSARIICTDADDGTGYPVIALVKSKEDGVAYVVAAPLEQEKPCKD